MMQTRWVCLGLAVLTLVCFGHVCLGEFINFDDPLYITDNPQVKGGLTWANVKWAFGASCLRAGYWVPLTWLSLQADASIFGPTAAWGFHLTNLIFHVANVVAFFLVLQRMTGDVGRSAMAAALFGLHPLRVESVAWVTERKDVLSTLLLILTVAAYVRYVEQPSWRRYGLMFAVFFLGLMAKPTLVTLPFALLLLDYWPLNRVRFGQSVPPLYAKMPEAGWRWLVLEKVPLLAAVAAIVPITLHYASAAIVAGVPVYLRLAIALSGYLGYLENTLWPVNLAILYPGKLPSPERVALAFLVLAAITFGALYLARRQPAIIVGWLWFLGTMFPVSGIAQTGPQALADRYTYVPHLGLVIAVVWGVSDSGLWRRLSGSLQKAVAFLVLAGLGALTWMQVGYWRDSDILFEHTLSVTKDNYLIHYCLAGYWVEQRRLEQAEVHFRKSVELAPHDFRMRLNYGVMLTDRLDRPEEAARQLQAAVRIEPNDPDAHYWLGSALAKMGQEQEAQDQWQQSVTCWQAHSMNYFFGDLKTRQALPHVALAESALRAARPTDALAHLTRALELKADHVETQQLLASALGRLGRWPDAETALVKAVELDPEDASTRGYLALAYSRQGKKELAAREYADIIKRFPDWPEKTADFALKKITQARLRDPLTALELAWQICEATDFKDPRWLNTLAAAQAANGDFAKARATAQQALALKPEPALTSEIHDRLRLYEKNQPLPLAKDKD